MKGSRGVYVVSSLDNSDDLRRMVTSLWRRNRVQVQVMLARDWFGAHELKARCGMLSTFDATVMLDTDVYVNGDISELFRVAESGRLGIYRHRNQGHWNSGVMAFGRELGARLSAEWAEKRADIAARYSRDLQHKSYYQTDQKSLNEIIHRYPVHPLGAEYNYIIPERTLEDEAKDWDAVRIFHFLHKSCPHRTSSRSFNEWKEL